MARLQHRQWADQYPDWTLAEAIAELRAGPGPTGLPLSWFAVADSPADGAPADDAPAADAQKEVVGVVMLVADGEVEDPSLSGPWLAGLVVVPAARRRSVGTRLVNHVVATAADLGCERLRLVTTSAMDLYTRLGWGFETEVHLAGHRAAVLSIDPCARGLSMVR